MKPLMHNFVGKQKNNTIFPTNFRKINPILKPNLNLI